MMCLRVCAAPYLVFSGSPILCVNNIFRLLSRGKTAGGVSRVYRFFGLEEAALNGTRADEMSAKP